MKYKIIVDSSSNLSKDYIKDEEVGFDVAPLTITIDNETFIDDDKMDVKAMLTKLSHTKNKPTSACPSPYDFSSKFEDADNIIVITITSKLSGAYNSAVVSTHDCTKNIHVIDSKLTAGAMRLIADKAYELMKEDTRDFDTLVKELEAYRDSIQLLFVLDSFDNLVRNGRMSKVVALIAKTLIIKPLCYGNNGEIEVKEKIRTLKGVLKRLVYNIGEMCPVTKGKRCIISHTLNPEDAEYLRSSIASQYEFDDIIVEENRGLCAFYSLEKGLIVNFG